MENAASTPRLRVLIGALAVVAVGAVIWATTALAGGGSSNSGGSEADQSPAAGFVQNRGERPSGEDCPERDNRGEESADVLSDL
jgi:hypothetical protein